MSTPVPLNTGFWDRAGIWLSSLCALHCVVMPILLAMLPLWSNLDVAHDWLHPVFAVLLIPVTLFALWGAQRAQRPRFIALLLGAGLVLVLGALFLPHEAGSLAETATTLVGSSLLIAGHVSNWRASHQHAPALASTEP